MPFLALGACAASPELEVAEDAWVYADRAISVLIDTPSNLNELSGRPHSLAIGVFQLTDTATFSAFTTTTSGMLELLSKGRIDDTVADFRLIRVKPGERRREIFARAQGARHVGLIAGYYNLTTADQKLFCVPRKASDRGIVEKSLAALNLIADTAAAKPTELAIAVTLGRTGTQQMEGPVLNADGRCERPTNETS